MKVSPILSMTPKLLHKKVRFARSLMHNIRIQKKPKTLLDNLCDYFRCTPQSLHDVLRSPIFFSRINNIYNGARFRTTYKSYMMNKIINFGTLSWLSASQLVAYEGAIDNMTVVQHFYGRYKLRLKYPHLPCVVVYGPRGHNRYYPLEVLTRCKQA